MIGKNELIILSILTLCNIVFNWYMSLIAGGFGVMMKDPGYVQLIIGSINLIAVYITARVEEKEMITKFGDEYKSYMNRTTMFIQFII